MKSGKISFIGLFLSLFFGAVVFIILLFVFDLTAQPYFELKLIFTAVNICAVIAVSTGAGAISSKITVPMFTAVSLATGIYTVLQFVSLGIAFSLSEIKFYLVFQLILLLVYFAVVLPIAKTGYNIAHKNQQ